MREISEIADESPEPSEPEPGAPERPESEPEPEPSAADNISSALVTSGIDDPTKPLSASTVPADARSWSLTPATRALMRSKAARVSPLFRNSERLSTNPRPTLLTTWLKLVLICVTAAFAACEVTTGPSVFFFWFVTISMVAGSAPTA